MHYETLTDACYAWVNEMNFIPTSVVEALDELHGGITELTPPTIGDRVYIFDDEEAGKEGEIVGTKYDGEPDLYEVRLDDEPDNPHIISSNSFNVQRESQFPMWGTMFSFKDGIDEEWINGKYLGPHLQEVADCGFRIYDSEDFGILLGIDAAGFNFYEAFWIPLYKIRGLNWHKVDDTEKETA